MLCKCSLNVHWMFTECSLNVHWMFTELLPAPPAAEALACWHPRNGVRALNVPWMFPECSLNVHWMFTECSLNVHWMFTECSLNDYLPGPTESHVRYTPTKSHVRICHTRNSHGRWCVTYMSQINLLLALTEGDERWLRFPWRTAKEGEA
jgi:hypothetical protein